MQRSLLIQDLTIHAVCLLLQMVLLYFHGFGWEGSTPPFVYPFWIILAAVTVFRVHEQINTFHSKLVLVPLILIAFLIGFCLVNEIGAVFWAFYTPRWYPVWVRILWYQSILFLQHPQIYFLVTDAAKRFITLLHQKQYFGGKIVILFLIAGIVMWLLRSQNLSPDGYDWLKHSVFEKNWTRYLREPLGTFILRTWVYWGMDWFHLAPHTSITLLTIVCGLIGSAFLYRVLQEWIDLPYVNPVFALIVGSFGYTQVFTGNIEIYALLQLGLVLFLCAVMLYQKGRYSAWHVGIWFGILFCIHLSAGWWIPAFLLFPLLKYDRHEISLWLPDIAKAVSSMAFVCLAFGLFVLGYGYQWDIAAIHKHFWSDQVMLVGTDAAMFRPLSDYGDPEYYLTMVNEYYFMFSGGCILVLTLICGLPYLSLPSKKAVWVLLLAGFYFVYSLIWRPDRHFPADWDLFSGLTLPAILFLSFLLIQSHLPKAAIRYILYQCTVFSGMYMGLQIARNHLQVSEWPPFL